MITLENTQNRKINVLNGIYFISLHIASWYTNRGITV